MYFGELFSRYYTYLFIIVILVYTVVFNRMMYRKVRGKFLTLLFLVLLQTVCSELEIQLSRLPYATEGRMIFSTVCYILRPSIMYMHLTIIIRNDSRKRKIIYYHEGN